MKNNISYLCDAAMIAAVYTALGLLFQPVSFGPVQCRVSEMLTVLPAFIPAAVPGVTAGCLLTNILGGAIVPDIIFGTLASFAGALLTRFFTGKVMKPGKTAFPPKRPGAAFRLAAVLPPVISNTLVIPPVLKYAYGFEGALGFMAVTVCIGELISAGLAGNMLITAVSRLKPERLPGRWQPQRD